MIREPYVPTGDIKFLKQLREAVTRNQEMDAVDGGTDLLPISAQLRTAISAFTSGMETKTWATCFEGLALLVSAEMMVRQLEEKIEIVVKPAKTT